MLPPNERTSRRKFADPVVIGIDVLELLSSAMYVDPLTIYREFIQNAADAIDEAEKQGLYHAGCKPKIEIHFDLSTRTAKIRDNGVGLSHKWFARRLTALGASKKRGAGARGFRGVGRLAGLGYCQELTFRSRTVGDGRVCIMHWDCRRLKELLRSEVSESDLHAVLAEIVSIDSCDGKGYPAHFFEVEMKQVIRHKSDVLLNEHAVRHYLAQFAPVPFSPKFKLATDIKQFLGKFGLGDSYSIFINSNPDAIVRPFMTDFEAKKGVRNSTASLETFELPGVETGIDAIGWIMHHDYYGALPTDLGMKGLRVRVGDIQVGDENTLNMIFPEPRFNAWTIGEVHIIKSRLVPNGRRDDFEQNSHYSNFLNQLAPIGKAVAKRCRDSSAQRAAAKKAAHNTDVPAEISWPKLRQFVAQQYSHKLNAAHRKALKALIGNRTGTYGALLTVLINPGHRKAAN